MILTALYGRGARQMKRAIETSGTTITFGRDPDLTTGATVDKTTLTVSDSTAATDVLVDEPAILVQTGTLDTPQGPGRTRTRATYRILLRPTATAVRQHDVGTVTAAQDAQLVGVEVRVTAAAVDPSGAFHNVVAVAR